jgi:hypothetical protein
MVPFVTAPQHLSGGDSSSSNAELPDRSYENVAKSPCATSSLGTEWRGIPTMARLVEPQGGGPAHTGAHSSPAKRALQDFPKTSKTEVGAERRHLGLVIRPPRQMTAEEEPVGELPSRLSRRRNVGAELQRSGLFTAASAESDSCDNSRDEDGPLHNLKSPK